MKLAHLSKIVLLFLGVCLAVAIREQSHKKTHSLEAKNQEEPKILRLPLKRSENMLKKTTMSTYKKVQKSRKENAKSRTAGDLETRPLPPGRTRINMTDYLHTDV